MVVPDVMQSSSQKPHASKRKLHNDSNDRCSKKRRAADPRSNAQAQERVHQPTLTVGDYSQIQNPLLSKLSRSFEVRTMSVMSSTSISKHVGHALEHLGRFNPWDRTVLPGVVLLCAKSSASSKLITIVELIKRRIGESEQKWFQYNVPKETVVEESVSTAKDASVVEDTFTAADRGNEDDADDEYFEAIPQTIHEQAVQPAKVRYKAHVVVMLSRVPLEELKSEPNVSVQTNEQHIEYLQRKRMGLAG
ncbi:hypothetical protein C7999DRAFT_12455 [Corynascus novoguineensis]|uniref:DNA/RNA-binding protein Alba-like domain-containing protein n=1 Tax=Corynascus novoguineensis TaxID=1126955 RepID=A0AAN7CZC2_9PEZI|nr:hypothetical protein C7999DRAFT_12455 [Corynascus novoguineensis]